MSDINVHYICFPASPVLEPSTSRLSIAFLLTSCPANILESPFTAFLFWTPYFLGVCIQLEWKHHKGKDSCLFRSLYSFPRAVIMNYYKLCGLKQQKYILSHSGGFKIKKLVSHTSSKGSRRVSTPCLFQLLVAPDMPGLAAGSFQSPVSYTHLRAHETVY